MFPVMRNCSCCEEETCETISQVNVTFSGVDVTVCDECRDPAIGPDFKVTSVSLDGSYGVPYESGTCFFNCPRSGATLTEVVYTETDGSCATVDETCTNIYLAISITLDNTESGVRAISITANVVCADDACTVTKFPAGGGASINVFDWNGSAENGADGLSNQLAACGTSGATGPGADGGEAEIWWGGSPADVSAIAGDPNACQYDYSADDCGVCVEGDPFNPPADDCP